MGDYSLDLSSAVNHISLSEAKEVTNNISVLFSTNVKLKPASDQTGQTGSGESNDDNDNINVTTSGKPTGKTDISNVNIKQVTSEIDITEKLMFEKSKSLGNVESENGISYTSVTGDTCNSTADDGTVSSKITQHTRSQSYPQNLCPLSETEIKDSRRIDSKKSADGFAFPIMQSNENTEILSKDCCNITNGRPNSLPLKNGENDKLILRHETSPICTAVPTTVPQEEISPQHDFTEPSAPFIMPASTNYWAFIGQNCEEFLSGMHNINGNFSVQSSQLSTTPSINHINSVLSAGLGNQSQSVNSFSNNLFPQQYQYQRRAITGAHNFGRVRHESQSLNQGYSEWNNPSQTWSLPQSRNSVLPCTWNTPSLAAVQKQSMSNTESLLKKIPVSCGHLPTSPSKFRRNFTWPFGCYAEQQDLHTSLQEDDVRQDTTLLPFQDRQISGSLNMSPLDRLAYPLEQQILEIMKTVQVDGQESKGYYSPNSTKLQSMGYTQAAQNYGRKQGKPVYFPDENHVLVDKQLEHLTPLGPTSVFHQKFHRIDDTLGRYSRKVFVGGLPPDIDEEEITATFQRFGPLVVDWPHKAESKSYFPPKGYAFLLFQEQSSVQLLIDSCIQEEDRLYLCVSSPTIKDKLVQIRPWRISDADYVFDSSLPLDPRKTVFVGGVPRPLKAFELATIMDRLYGGVCYAGIDTDPELKYPKGAGRVAFSSQQSYIAAISARFVQLQHGDIEKRVEVKPYVLDDQMCDECQGARCGGKFAPFFCANVTCLQYYCEQCWAAIHSRPGREFHKPLVKEGADRPRAVPFRWY
ncbi:cytoplasmic polyadenylation element-binding protein 3-like isoform X1 [Tachypleus tridentatus]|uniref:cytoplasmic polyadenylation element-binding protein 3-like isoform X1 n=1 Tax=Tachypleus tridentatus TaxID=6853 RepID=UPI003FD571E6